MIPFNIPYSSGKETACMQEAQALGHIAGNGHFTRLCGIAAERLFGYKPVFFTPSCTSALTMAALLCDLRPGDEVILPSFTHPGTANAFLLAGVTLRFADCGPDQPNIDPLSVSRLIGPRTRVLVVVHYAGVACDMAAFRGIAGRHGLWLIEDAAHAIGARFGDEWLGSQGDMAAFSFHETKNITCGQGGMLVVNRPELESRAREIWQQGTNRWDFEQGAVPHYTWTRTGGAFLLPDLNAAYLYPQLCSVNEINAGRMERWRQYYETLLPLQEEGLFRLPQVPVYAWHNAHIFHLLAATPSLRDGLIAHLNRLGIQAVFHYIPLHSSPHGGYSQEDAPLPYADDLASRIVRLPLYNRLSLDEVGRISGAVLEWAFKNSTYHHGTQFTPRPRPLHP